MATRAMACWTWASASAPPAPPAVDAGGGGTGVGGAPSPLVRVLVPAASAAEERCCLPLLLVVVDMVIGGLEASYQGSQHVGGAYTPIMPQLATYPMLPLHAADQQISRPIF